MDRIEEAHRSWNMSRIRSKDTKPEKVIRSALFSSGFRFRLHRKDLPGSPDIVLPKYRTVIFVNGCFWHRHPNCRYAYTPKSRIDFWQKKFDRNVERDKINQKKLEDMDWQVLVIWECEIKEPDLETRLRNAIHSNLNT